MLRSLKVESLFGLYSYNLDFTNQDETAIKFLTGPNGYGKTTVLSLIYSLYTCDFNALMQVPFNTLIFNFGEQVIKVQQRRIYAEQEDDSDEEHLKSVELEIIFLKSQPTIAGSEDEIIERILLNKGENGSSQEANGQNLRLYFQSLPCYYIKDQRLLHKKTVLESSTNEEPISVSAVYDNADHFCHILKEQANLFAESYQVLPTTDLTIPDEASYNERKKTIQPLLEKLHQYELIPEIFPLYDYSPENAPTLNLYLDALNHAIEKVRPFLQKLDTFVGIIERSQFANKHLEISPRYGFRFIADDSDHTILSLSDLSSGEQHILIQTYELLFKAEHSSLVLMDEPEISYHLAWQVDFLRNMKEIVKLRGIQCIIGTHSPQMFNSDWKLSVDLYTQSTQNA